jgi:hypothetical protein
LHPSVLEIITIDWGIAVPGHTSRMAMDVSRFFLMGGYMALNSAFQENVLIWKNEVLIRNKRECGCEAAGCKANAGPVL